jgi:hypothetical protein
MSPAPLTVVDVADQANAVLSDFPYIARRIGQQKIIASVKATWPDPPAPLIYWLWVAGDSTFSGAAPARQELASLELILMALDHLQVVDGSWPSRVAKLYPPNGHAGKDHVTEFRSAQFELLLAFQLFREDVTITVQGDGGPPACDLIIVSGRTKIAAIEAYAPQKDIDDWYQRSVVMPWRTLIGAPESEPVAPRGPEPVRDIFLDPAAVPLALSNILTDGNFSRQKVRQLASGDLPTLLAIRAYSLTSRLENLLTIESAQVLAAAISEEAWTCLPELCVGLLLCFTPDILGAGAHLMFLPAPGRSPDENLKNYLTNIGAMA